MKLNSFGNLGFYPVGKIVEAQNRIARLEKAASKIAANKTSDASNKDFGPFWHVTYITRIGGLVKIQKILFLPLTNDQVDGGPVPFLG